jgi:cellulose synthase/poly-beta-1,6-N-acetylglucosamine synthase-like glycosyltransferase
MSLAIVIPTRNESERLKTKLPEIRSVFPDAHILIVNTPVEYDKTKKIVELNDDIYVESKHRFGKSLTYGLYLCRDYDFVISMDADHDPKSAELMYKALSSNKQFDLAIGIEDSKRIQRDVVNVMMRILLGLKLENPTCGLRCYRGSIIRHIIPREPDEWFFIQIQLLYNTIKLGKKAGKGTNYIQVPFPAAEHTGVTENFNSYKRFFTSLLKFSWENR